jgi:hypothetical protein
MTPTLIYAKLAAGQILAAPGGGPAIHTQAILTYILQIIVPILLAIIGVFIIMQFKSAKMSKVMNMAGIALVGIGFILGSGAFIIFARQLVNLAIG